ncbi:T9SS type A sorting domain-containing protein [Flavobacterium zepuense]|uniref:T9SS type A sorting domain-containing protein n=1 Tax=Flavobacterium zepuense TaxID=2593302 RepID=UPI00163D8717|nr:T9SS type A sorting domain-containing protein [Flavobacterium zepuense]
MKFLIRRIFTMKTTMFCFFLLFTALAGAQVISIPDAAFKAALLSATTNNDIARDNDGDSIIIDVNGDGNIQQSEALMVFKLKVENEGIASLAGVEYFYNLHELECNENQLTVLNVAGLNYLEAVECADNQIIELDFSANPMLTELICNDNNLTYIGLKNGAAHSSGTNGVNEWGNNPDLEFVCIDDFEVAAITTILAASGLTDVNANQYCSFTPGGGYNTITGNIIFDGDNDGCDTDDVPQSFIKIVSTNGVQSCATFTSLTGSYDIYTPQGVYAITPQFENNFFTATPVSATSIFTGLGATDIKNFCVTANTYSADVEVVMVPVVPATSGGSAVYKIVYKNKGSVQVSGAVSCTWNTQLFSSVYTAPTANYAGPSVYSWNFTDLKPFENREIVIYLDVNGSTDNPPVNTGDVINFTALAAVNSTDVLPGDNNFVYHQTVPAMVNPNNIMCVEGNTQPATAIGNYLHYGVNFKNTGTETAQNVVITHDLNPDYFDINTLELLNSSEEVTATTANNTITFLLRNVNLAADGGGNILFKVKTKTSLQSGMSVSNQARIFYDYKLPVETNETNTVFGVLSTGDFEIDNSVIIYPNPTSGIIKLDADSNLQSIELYDVQGRLLQTAIINDVTATVDISTRATGMYFLKVTTAKGVKVEKIMKK